MTSLRHSLTGLAGTSSPSAVPAVLPVPSSLPAGCSLWAVETPDGLKRLAADWRTLEEQAPAGSHVFQSFGWIMAWTQTYGPRLQVLTGYRHGRLVFAWPLMLVRVGPVQVLRWLGEPHAQYGDILAAPGECPKPWAAAALDHLARDGRADIIRLRHVRADALIAPFLDTVFRPSGMEDAAPSLDLTVFADEEAYEARYTSTQRKRRRKIRKALEERLGPVRFAILTAPAERSAAIRRAIVEKARWVDERGRHNRILACPRLAGFLERLASEDAPPGPHLVVSELSAGGRPVSWEIALRHGRTHFCFITAHPGDLTDLSPARLHMDLSQRQALRDGLTRFDLMVPDDPHKVSWCNTRTPTRDHHFPLTPLGRLYGTGYLESLRPLLRETYRAAPPTLLRLLKPVLGH